MHTCLCVSSFLMPFLPISFWWGGFKVLTADWWTAAFTLLKGNQAWPGSPKGEEGYGAHMYTLALNEPGPFYLFMREERLLRHNNANRDEENTAPLCLKWARCQAGGHWHHVNRQSPDQPRRGLGGSEPRHSVRSRRKNTAGCCCSEWSSRKQSGASSRLQRSLVRFCSASVETPQPGGSLFYTRSSSSSPHFLFFFIYYFWIIGYLCVFLATGKRVNVINYSID